MPGFPHASAWEYTAIIAVTALGAMIVRIFARRIAPALAGMRSPATIVDALAPLALMAPLLGACWHIQWDVRGAGWLPIGAPIICGLLAAGCAAITVTPASLRPTGSGVPLLAVVTWWATGALLLLLGAANDLTIWVGQCGFVAGAVLLWMNSPAAPVGSPGESEMRAGGGASMVLLLAIAQGVAVSLLPAPWLKVAGGIIIAQAAMALALTARLASAELAMRLGGWTATYGLLLSLGTISLRHLLPRAVDVVRGERVQTPVKVAFGFGEYAIEATILLMLGVFAIALDRVSSARLRAAIGMLLILAAAVLAGWRLASM